MKAFLALHFPRTAKVFGINPQPLLEVNETTAESEEIASLRSENDRLSAELADTRNAAQVFEAWKVTALPVFIQFARNAAARIDKIFVAEKKLREEATRQDHLFVTQKMDAHLHNRDRSSMEAGERLGERLTAIDQLVEFVLKHQLDKSLVFAIPREQIREWTVRRAECGELVNGKIGQTDVPWAEELLAYGLFIQTTKPEPAARATAEA